MPSNIYGNGEIDSSKNSHAIPALFQKFLEAKIKGKDAITCWGTRDAKRKFLHADDLSSACLLLLEILNAKAGFQKFRYEAWLARIVF